MSAAREITAALAGRWHRTYGMCRCVVHDDRTPSLSIADGHTAIIVKCHAGCDPLDILAELRRRGLLDDRRRDDTPWQRHAPRRAPPPPPHRDGDRTRTIAAMQIWQSARFAQPGTPVALYVEQRGMAASAITAEAIRYVPRLKHFDTDTQLKTWWPAMVALFLDARDLPVAIHRTWLTAAGDKAPVTPHRKMLGPVTGAAIRLTDAGAMLRPGTERRLIVGEGIETMMALLDSDAGDNADVWATGSTSGLRSLVLPSAWRWRVIIAADQDHNSAGQNAAADAAARLRAEGHTAGIVLPGVDGADFNDLLRAAA